VLLAAAYVDSFLRACAAGPHALCRRITALS